MLACPVKHNYRLLRISTSWSMLRRGEKEIDTELQLQAGDTDLE